MVRTTTRVLGIAGWLLATAASGCGGGGGGGGGSAVPGPASPGGANTSPVTTPALVYPPPSTWPHLPAARGANTGNFTTSEACAKCHSNDPRASAMRDAQGRGVAPYDLWQGTMMANATRDPLWRAQVSVEIAATPSLRATIEKKCISCHAPMARAEAEDAGEVFDLAALDRGDARSQLGLDGVSCAACHQLEVDPQQIDASFDGNYTMGRRRELRGPHANPLGTPMSAAIGFLPVEDPEFTSSALCAGCHTLRTSAFDASGAPTGGSLPEQTPYLEWRNSVFNDELATPGPDARSCQGCHMPTTDEDGAPITTRIARDGGRDFPIPARSPYGRHVFVGGNTLIPAILRDSAQTCSRWPPTRPSTR